MAKTYAYDPWAGRMYAQAFALYDNVPPEQRLFYYAEGADCTNFISQCVWAAYGGWIPGFSESIVKQNAERIRADVRQVKGIWYGSKSNIGSNRWCRVEEFFAYTTDRRKTYGPMANKIAEGGWDAISPDIVKVGDIISFVVTSYTPDRFGHNLYVTKAGGSWDDVLICCHTEDRLDEPMSWFEQFPDIYSKLRIIRFGNAVFES